MTQRGSLSVFCLAFLTCLVMLILLTLPSSPSSFSSFVDLFFFLGTQQLSFADVTGDGTIDVVAAACTTDSRGTCTGDDRIVMFGTSQSSITHSSSPCSTISKSRVAVVAICITATSVNFSVSISCSLSFTVNLLQEIVRFLFARILVSYHFYRFGYPKQRLHLRFSCLCFLNKTLSYSSLHLSCLSVQVSASHSLRVVSPRFFVNLVTSLGTARLTALHSIRSTTLVLRGTSLEVRSSL